MSTNESGQYATGDRVFQVTQSGATEWQATDGTVTGSIYGDGVAFTWDVDDSSEEGQANTMMGAVQGIAHATRTVEATPAGRVIASRWASPGTVGAVLAQFATTGKARADLLTDDAERTQLTDSASIADMEALLSDSGNRDMVTVKSLTEAHAREFGADLATTAGHVLSEIAESYPYLITDAASARDVFHDIWAVWSDNV